MPIWATLILHIISVGFYTLFKALRDSHRLEKVHDYAESHFHDAVREKRYKDAIEYRDIYVLSNGKEPEEIRNKLTELLRKD